MVAHTSLRLSSLLDLAHTDEQQNVTNQKAGLGRATRTLYPWHNFFVHLLHEILILSWTGTRPAPCYRQQQMKTRNVAQTREQDDVQCPGSGLLPQGGSSFCRVCQAPALASAMAPASCSEESAGRSFWALEGRKTSVYYHLQRAKSPSEQAPRSPNFWTLHGQARIQRGAWRSWPSQGLDLPQSSRMIGRAGGF